jgi:hypothetical protein
LHDYELPELCLVAIPNHNKWVTFFFSDNDALGSILKF